MNWAPAECPIWRWGMRGGPHGRSSGGMIALLAGARRPTSRQPARVWRLLTNRPTGRLEDVVQLIDGYRKRWWIEVFAEFWKAGCRVGALQRRILERLERALVVDPIIAWRILHLVTWDRDCPPLPCDVVCDPEKWTAACGSWPITPNRPKHLDQVLWRALNSAINGVFMPRCLIIRWQRVSAGRIGSYTLPQPSITLHWKDVAQARHLQLSSACCPRER